MAMKIYYYIAAFVLLFSVYYDYITHGVGIYFVVSAVVEMLLILAGYCYFFNYKLLDSLFWKRFFYVLMGGLGVMFLLQFTPKLLQGDFSIYFFNLGANVLGFLIGVGFFTPLFFAVYELSVVPVKSSKKSKKKK